MCGEHEIAAAPCLRHKGSPPHVRGTRLPQHVTARCPGITPACAGNTKKVEQIAGGGEDHPRMCGEHVLFALKSDVT